MSSIYTVVACLCVIPWKKLGRFRCTLLVSVPSILLSCFPQLVERYVDIAEAAGRLFSAIAGILLVDYLSQTLAAGCALPLPEGGALLVSTWVQNQFHAIDIAISLQWQSAAWRLAGASHDLTLGRRWLPDSESIPVKQQITSLHGWADRLIITDGIIRPGISCLLPGL